MPRRSRQPLELRGREIRLYKGDWERLEEILAPRRLKPSAFIRELVAKMIRRVEDNQTTETADEHIDLDELESAGTGHSNEP